MTSQQVRDVLVVLFDGVQSLDVTGPVEVFAGAAHCAEGGVSPYRLRTASVGGQPVRTSSGLTLVPDTALGRGHPGPAHPAGARRVRHAAPATGAPAVAAGARAARRAAGVGVHGRPAARRRGAAQRAAGHDPLGVLRPARADPPGHRRGPGPHLRAGRPHRHLGRGDGGHRPRPWRWSRRTSAGRSRSRWPAIWWCSCGGPATRRSSASSWRRRPRGGSRCGRCSSGSASTPRRTCPCRRSPNVPASRPRHFARAFHAGDRSAARGATWTGCA